MQKKKYILIGFLVILAGVLGFVLLGEQIERVLAGPGDSASGWAWIGLTDSGGNASIGYLSFNSTNCDSDGDGLTDQGNFAGCPIGDPITDYGVDIDSTGLFSGEAWSENIGWVSFEDLAGCPQLPCEAKLDFVSDEVSGWARALSAVGEPEAGGWDGWIKLRGAAQDSEEYGVWYDDNTDPANPRLMGWAWGGDDDGITKANIGWVSFSVWNPEPPPPPPDPDDPPPPPIIPPGPSQDVCSPDYCRQQVNPRSQYASCDNSSSCSTVDQVYLGEVQSTDCNAAAGSYCVCCADDISVIIDDPNLPPLAPDALSETFLPCSWGSSPQAALGLIIRLNWIYLGLDPEGDDQLGYQVQVDDSADCASPLRDYTAPEPAGATLWNIDAPLNWSAQYYWRVRVKDFGSEDWSDWSVCKQFTDATPAHALPNPNFKWNPFLPSTNEVIQVCSENNAAECSFVNCALPPGGCSKCYDYIAGSDLEVECLNHEDPVEMNYFVWTIAAGAPGEFVGDSVWRAYVGGVPVADNQQSTSTNPQMKFDSAGTYVDALELKITDDLGSCAESKAVQISIPIPKWKEISP